MPRLDQSLKIAGRVETRDLDIFTACNPHQPHAVQFFESRDATVGFVQSLTLLTAIL